MPITFIVAQKKINKEGENARGQWTAYGIKTTDASWLSGLSPAVEGLAQLEEGDLVTAETKTDGNYTNITKILNVRKPSEEGKLHPEGAMPVKSPPGASGGVSSDDLRFRSMMLSYAKDLVIGGKLDIKDILTSADKFYLWLKEQGK